VRRIVAQYNGADTRYALTDCELKVFRPGEAPDQRIIEPAEVPDVLRDIFGLSLPTESMKRLVTWAQASRDITTAEESLGT
jgi:N-hydroxyarylamine O-acetyltransferase